MAFYCNVIGESRSLVVLVDILFPMFRFQKYTKSICYKLTSVSMNLDIAKVDGLAT